MITFIPFSRQKKGKKSNKVVQENGNELNWTARSFHGE